MRKAFIFLLLIIPAIKVFSVNFNPENDDNPKDTIKAYYLDEIVVSSSVKETNELRNLPTAVSFISPKQLSNNQTESLPDLSGVIPNFFIPSYGSRVSTPVYIRGIGARYGAQTVSLYVDNVPSFNPSAFDFEFQDIQRVEVLRGAQGTLYGRNAIGGIVNIYTMSPLTFQGTSLMVNGGSYGRFAASGSNYSKLSDKVGLSVAAYHKRDDGYFYNNYTGKKMDGSDNTGGKMKLEWNASSAFKAMFFANYDHFSQGAFPYMHEDSTASNFNEPSNYKRDLVTNGLTLNYFGEGYSINSTTGYQFLKDDMRMDQDYTPLSVFSIRQQQKQHSVSQEITIKSENKSRYKWVVGAFGFYDHRTIDTPVMLKEDFVASMQAVLDALADRSPAVPIIKYTKNQLELPGIYKKPVKGAAIFHQSTLNELFGLKGLSATAGIRFDYEHTGIDFFTESIGNEVTIKPKNAPPAMPPVTVNGDTTMTGNFSKNYWEILPKFALKYQTGTNSFLYLSASEAYKTGGYNEQAFSKILQNALQANLMGKALGGGPGSSDDAPTLKEQLSYSPERSWTYELGGRFEMFNRMLSATFALFSTHVDNIQIVKLIDQGTSGRIVTNAGKSASKGAELSLRYNPTINFTLFTEYGFADAKFKKYVTDDGDYSGNYIPFAPQHTLTIGSSYVINLGSQSFLNRIVANIQHTGAGKIYWTEDNTAVQPFYGQTGASLAVGRGPISLEVWGKNIFDTNFNTFYFKASDMSGKENAFVQRSNPARFGITLKYLIDR